MMTRIRDWMIETGKVVMIEDMCTFVTLEYILVRKGACFLIIKCDL